MSQSLKKNGRAGFDPRKSGSRVHYSVCLIKMPAVRVGCDSASTPANSPNATWQNHEWRVTDSQVEVGEQDAVQ